MRWNVAAARENSGENRRTKHANRITKPYTGLHLVRDLKTRFDRFVHDHFPVFQKNANRYPLKTRSN